MDFLSSLFSNLFGGFGMGGGVAPAPAAPDPLLNLFGVNPQLGVKYGTNGFMGSREIADWETPQPQEPAIEPVTSITDAVMAPFQDASTSPMRPNIRTFGMAQGGRAASELSPVPRSQAATPTPVKPLDLPPSRNSGEPLRDTGPTSPVSPGRNLSELRPMTFTEEVSLNTGPNMLLAADRAAIRAGRVVDTSLTGGPIRAIPKSVIQGKSNVSNTTGKRPVAPAKIPSNIASIIDRYAEEAGIDKALAQRIAHIESSGNPRAVTGSYKGLYQLSNSEFKRFGGGDIFNAEHNARAGLLKLAAERDHLAKLLGREVTPAEIYLAHQQGIGGAVKHLSNPDQAAWKSMYQTGEGQQKGERWAKRAIWGNIPYNLRKQFGSVENVTSKDFVELWRRKVEG